MNFFKGFFIVICGILVASGLYLWSGRYNISATVPHWRLTAWLLEEAKDQSIAYHSKGIQSPSLLDAKRISRGFEHFHTTCRLCHGAPDFRSLEFASGMNPRPPNLQRIQVQKETDGELYWIIKNGIRMTGMPAFGPTHNDEQLWEIIAFLRQLPDMTREDYSSMVRGAKWREKTKPRERSRPAP